MHFGVFKKSKVTTDVSWHPNHSNCTHFVDNSQGNKDSAAGYVKPKRKCILIGRDDIGIAFLVNKIAGRNSSGIHDTEIAETAILQLLGSASSTHKIPCRVELIETFFIQIPAGDYYSQIRPIAYGNTSVFILCFDLTDNSSLAYWIMDKLFQEIRECNYVAPLLLVGLKKDKRDEILKNSAVDSEENKCSVTTEHGLAASHKMKCSAYIELTTSLDKKETEVFLMEVTRCIARDFTKN